MEKKKDILFLCQFFYPEYVSSATLPYDTALALKEAGFRVDALCGYPYKYHREESVPLRETVNGMEIHRLKYLCDQKKGKLSRLVSFFSFTVSAFFQLKEMAKYRSVIVYSNPPVLPWVAACAKRLFGTKLVFVAYDLYPEAAVRTGTIKEKSLLSQVMKPINNAVFRSADAVVALSGEMRDFLIKHRPVSPDRVLVIPNWYSDQGKRGNCQEDNPFRKLADGRFVVSYFGNMGTAQDMQTILDTVRILKEEPVMFLFAGHGNKMRELRRIVEAEGLTNVVIRDFLHGREFQEALESSDGALVSLERGLTGLCVPSKTYSYMMQGIPLLAIMDEGDIVSDIEQGAGCWVRNGESGKLADAIRHMRENPEVCRSMAEACRRLYLEKYTTEICTGQYVELFRTRILSENEE